jgi:ATP-binding cassette subfamily B protein
MASSAMTSLDNERDDGRLTSALRRVMRHYAAQLGRWRLAAAGALLLPAVADVLTFYAPPLVVARLLRDITGGEPLPPDAMVPYIATFALLWLGGQIAWRIAIALISRVEIRGMQALYIEAMNDLLAKDLAFFHDNYAGSLTKRALGYARRFEDVFDVLSFQVMPTVLPLGFVGVVLWAYSPWLLVVLVGMMIATFAMVLPLIRRRRRLVDIRETASNVLAGHVADSITNAEAVRAFAREEHEARIHAGNVGDYAAKTLKSWDYQNMRVDLVTSPMFVVTNVLGLVIALSVGQGTGASLEVVFITFSYYTTATRVMWEFNRIYRNMESALTDAAQFAELLLDPPSVVDAAAVEPFAPKDFGVELREVSFRYSRSQPLLFDRLSIRIAAGAKVGLVGRSGGGKTTLTRLLLRFADVEAGEILIGGQSITRVAQNDLRNVIAYVRRIRRCSIAASWTTSGWAGPMRATPRYAARRSWRMLPSSSTPCRRVTEHWWASAASSSPAGNVSASRLPGRFSKTRRSSSWTKRRAHSTPRAKRSSRMRC